MAELRQIRVLIVDDHAMVREGLATFIDSFDDLVLVGEASEGSQAISLCGQLHPDIVLMDLIMAGMDGTIATREICRVYPDIRVIVLTSFVDESLIKAVLQAGAISYLLKDVSASELAAAIRAAYAGKRTMASEATQVLIQAATNPAAPADDLTVRELEVLKLIVAGLANAEIANQLGISRYTVKNHLVNIFAKLEVTTRTEAATQALKRHIVQMD